MGYHVAVYCCCTLLTICDVIDVDVLIMTVSFLHIRDGVSLGLFKAIAKGRMHHGNVYQGRIPYDLLILRYGP